MSDPENKSAPTAADVSPAKPQPDRARVTRGLRVALVLGPPVAVAAVWWLVGTLTSRTGANEALAAGAVFLTIVGPSVIFGPAVVGTNVFERLSTWDLVAVTAFFSCATAFLYSYNLDLLERMPGIGAWLRRARGTMLATLDAKPWIRKWAVLGVGFFVLLPLPGSGTLGGSIVARLIGLSPFRSFVAVSVGGVIVCLAYGWFGESLLRFGERHQLSLPTKIAGALVFVVALAAIGRWLGRKGRAATSPAESASDRRDGG